MACIMLQYDIPTDPDKLREYSYWVANDAMPSISKALGLKEMRAYRNFGKGSPEITVMIEFGQLNHAMSFLATETWNNLLTTCPSFGVSSLLVNLLVDSPLVPEPLKA